jgi:hypothetical protein
MTVELIKITYEAEEVKEKQIAALGLIRLSK